MELNEAIINRRSIRKFTDYHVTDEEINDILEAARMAPSWENSQVWEFIVIRDREIIERIVNTYPELNPARKCSLAASALIVLCAKPDISGYFKGKLMTKFPGWFMFDLGMAAENICLRAHDLGLGSVVVGWFDHNACRDILKVPEDKEVVVIIPLGRPAVEGKKGPPRKELKDIVHVNSYGNPY